MDHDQSMAQRRLARRVIFLADTPIVVPSFKLGSLKQPEHPERGLPSHIEQRSCRAIEIVGSRKVGDHWIDLYVSVQRLL
jgi:hypothetical protein